MFIIKDSLVGTNVKTEDGKVVDVGVVELIKDISAVYIEKIASEQVLSKDN